MLTKAVNNKLSNALATFFISSTVAFSPTLLASSLDPVSSYELSKAAAVVFPATAESDQAERGGVALSRTSEVLSIETHLFNKGSENNAPRLIDVFSYNYDNNKTTKTVVNLDTNKVVSSSSYSKMQLPLTQREVQYALSVVFDDADEMALLKQEYNRITGGELVSQSQLEVKAFTFFAETMPGQINQATQICGQHRCAQLVLFTPEKIVFEVSPIVNLSEGIVSQHMGY